MLAVLAASTQGVLATVNKAGFPHLTNMLYQWDAEALTARFMTGSTRAKVRQLRANPQAALHVSGGDFWSFVVAEGRAELSEPSTARGDAVGLELLAMSPHIQPHEHEAFLDQMVIDQRMVIRLKASRIYGTALQV
jgi:PPOX class probable F420-dependent enzyme